MCFLTRSFSDPQPVQLLNGSAAADGHVAPASIIDRQITRQPVVAFLGVLEGHRIGPFLTEGLDKALGLSVGAGRVRPGADVLKAKGFAGLGKAA